MMVSAFFVISLIQSQWPNPTTFADISHIFPTFMATPLIFLTLIIACLGVSAGELFLRFKQDEEEQEQRNFYDAEVKKQNKMFEQQQKMRENMKMSVN